MKLQHLSIIFVIIILPISLVLSVFIESQADALNLQTEYDSRLISATYDAVKAFQLNTLNNSTSNVANSKIRDIEASVNTFFNSLSSSFGLTGYRANTIKQYVPAIVYTMYDGYYIYTPFDNKNNLGINNDGNTIYGLKPYVYYSCRYIKGNDDIVITYSLDNYITIQGMINGEYVNDAGYLLSNVEVNGEYITYDGIDIKKEGTLTQKLVGYNFELPYIKEKGTTYYLDEAEGRVFYLLNGTEVNQAKAGTVIYEEYKNKIENNSSAISYYKEAYEFTKRVKDKYKLDKWVSSKYACDENGKYYESEKYSELSDNSGNKIFADNKIPIEYDNSAFNVHRLAIIRHSIETNLAVAIAGYNKYFDGTNDFQMPNLREDEWDLIMNNVSIISFLQGINTKGNMYNGYAIVTNNSTKEVVQPENIYIVENNEYHKITDKDLIDKDLINAYGALSLDFKRRSIIDLSGITNYYYPESALACSNCIINQSEAPILDENGIYKYISNIKNQNLKQKYYTALGRERYGNK